jgi:preprotein translocase subunit SecE
VIRDDVEESRGGIPMSLMARAGDFVKDVQVESKKVSWPTRNELRDSTTVVIVTCLILTVFVWITDSVLRMGVGLLFR